MQNNCILFDQIGQRSKAELLVCVIGQDSFTGSLYYAWPLNLDLKPYLACLPTEFALTERRWVAGSRQLAFFGRCRTLENRIMNPDFWIGLVKASGAVLYCQYSRYHASACYTREIALL